MSEELKRWLETGNVTKLPSGRAYGATHGGMICKKMSSNAKSKAAKRHKSLQTRVYKAKKLRKQHWDDPPTACQKDYAKYLGILLPSPCTKRKARELIQAHLAKKNFSK